MMTSSPWTPTTPIALPRRRSLALHREVARRLHEHPELLDDARARVERWLRDGTAARRYAQAWAEILARDLEHVEASMVDPSPRARDLRQCSPFAGALDPRTRWRILRGFRERSER